MPETLDFLKRAKEAGVLTDETFAELEAFYQAGKADGPAGQGLMADLARPAYPDDEDGWQPSESPRLVRGFHDILITIGILASGTGLWVFGYPLVTVIAMIALTEYFVKRQNLALPAFVLNFGFAISAGALVFDLLPSGSALTDWSPVIVTAAMTLALIPYYWRYRIPVSLATVLGVAFMSSYLLVILLFGIDFDAFDPVDRQLHLIGSIGFVFAFVLFGFAMWFDAGDRLRRTRRSDVAFWLHLGAAPALVYTAMLTVLGPDGFLFGGEPTEFEAVTGILIITVMILVGILIDRRAFVTSGLLSLGAAFFILTENTGFDFSTVIGGVFVAVGAVVLLLGSGWARLRKIMVNGLVPEEAADWIPPVR